MGSKGRLTITIALAVVLLAAGITAVALGNYGTQSDPLVTLSYIEETVTKNFEKYAQETADNMEKNIVSAVEDKAEQLSDSVDAKLDEVMTAPKCEVFETVSLRDGQKLTCEVGTELMLRSGSASASGVSLADTGKGTAVTNEALAVNHMYVVTVKGDITASGEATLLVKGNYSVS